MAAGDQDVEADTPLSGEAGQRQRGDAVRWVHPSASRELVLAVGTGLLVVAVLCGQAHPATAVVGLLGLTTQAAGALAPGQRPSGPGLVGLLPAGLVVVCFALLAITFGAGALGISVWGTRLSSLLGVSALGVLFTVACLRRGGDIVLWNSRVPVVFSALLGLLLAGSVIFRPQAISSRLYGMGTDFLRHLVTVESLRGQGAIHPGTLSYPGAFRVLVGSLTAAGGVQSDLHSLWNAANAVTLGLLVLVGLALTSLASAVAGAISADRRAPGAASFLAGLAFLQTAWFFPFLATGSVMNMLAALCLLTVLGVALDAQFTTSLPGLCIVVAALGVVSNGWQLVLPMAGLMALPPLAWSLRQRTGRGWRAALVGVGALVSMAGLAGIRNSLELSSTTAGEDVSGLVAATFSGLTKPEWWWWLSAAACARVVVLLWHAGARAGSLCVGGALVGLVGQTVWLLRASGSGWELPRYYPAKALWTGLIVLLAVSVAGGVWALAAGWRRSGEWGSWQRGAGRAFLGLSTGLAAVALAGRMAATEPHLVSILRGPATPSWSLAVLADLQNLPADDSRLREPGAVVFGVVPSVTEQELAGGQPGRVDAIVLDSLAALGLPDVYQSPMKAALVRQDLSEICEHLREFPAALRVTGPNPQSGPQRLLDEGCPAPVVASDTWVRVQLSGDWLSGTRWADRGAWAFPGGKSVPALAADS